MKHSLYGAGLSILLLLIFMTLPLLAQDEEPITVVGSGIGIPVIELIAGEIESDINLEFDVTGSSRGFNAFCNGDSDAVTTIRSINIDENLTCENNAVEYVELLVGHEILVFASNTDVDFVDCLSLADINNIFAPSATDSIANWQDLNAEYSDLALSVVSPDDTNPLFGILNDLVDGDGIRADAVAVADSAEAGDEIAGTSGAIGVTNVTTATALRDDLRILQVNFNNDAGCIPPSAENTEANIYEASNPILLYVNSQLLENEAVTEFLTSLTSDEAIAVLGSAGFTGASETAAETNQRIISGEEEGRQFSGEVSDFQIPTDVAGTVSVQGAPEAFTVVNRLASAFTGTYSTVTVDLGLMGETNGIDRLCAGEGDIVLASNGLNDEQIATCEENDVTVAEILIGTEAVVLLTNEANDDGVCLTTDQIATIWGTGSTDTVNNWNTVDESFSDLEMILFGIWEGHHLADLLLSQSGTPIPAIRADTEQDNDVFYRAAATANVDGGITYMSYSEYQRVIDRGQERVQLVAVDTGGGCVSPDEATIPDGSYALSRPTILMMSQSALNRSEVQSLLWFMFSNENFTALSTGDYVGLEIADLAQFRENLQSAFLMAEETQASATEDADDSLAEATDEPNEEATEEPDAE